jgi:hypothetical protein
MPTGHGGSFWKKGQDVAMRQLAADEYYLTSSIDSVRLKD